MIAREPVKAPRGAAQQRWAAGAPVKGFEDRRKIAGNPFALLHRGARLGEFGLLARLRGECYEFRNAMFEPFAIALSLAHRRAGCGKPGFGRAPRSVALRHRARVGARIGIEQRAVPRRRKQAAVVMLAMNLHQLYADLAQQRRRTGLVVEKCAAAAVGFQRPADQQRLARLDRNVIVGEQPCERRARHGRCKACGYLRLVGALPYERGVGAHPEREAERIEQDRLARPGLARQHAKPILEIEIEPLDQHDIGDGERGQHDLLLSQNKMRIYRAMRQACGACLCIRSKARLYHLLPG